jgi:hypothetical protein
MKWTMKRAAQSALDVQFACNLSGVVRTFAELVSWMRTDLHFDTPTCNTHPVCRLFAEQITYLTSGTSGDNVTYSVAYEWCKANAADVPATV